MSVSEEKGKSTDKQNLSEKPPIGEEKSIDPQDVVPGARKRTLTERGKQMHEEDAKRHS